MIMEDVAENSVTIGGEIEVGQFRIKESAKAFAILSSSLYKNKIRAIIRELSCNARDSRIAAGMSEDFIVHLPTKFEPEFFIRDEGTGLSHDEVMSLYTTYFESTKTNSNAYVGALGLGSKSPFSYTENFTVTAIKDGVRGLYSAFINETGVPSIVCLFSGPTEEPNGVEVRLPVAFKDHRDFLNEATYVYCWFDVKPTCNLPLYYYTTEKKHEYYSEIASSLHSIILMGGVAYEFDMADFVPSAVAGMKFLFRVGIGEVDVLPSREGLQNTAKTKSIIIGTYQRILDLEQSKIELELEKIDSVYEKISYLNHLSGGAMEKHIKNALCVNKFPKNNIVSFTKLNDINMKCFGYSNHAGKKTPKQVHTTAITPSQYVKFIYNDVGAPITQIKAQFNSGSCSVYVFNQLDNTAAIDFEAFRIKTLLGASVVLASSFFVKPVRNYTYTYKKSDKMGVMSPHFKKSTSRYGNYHYVLKNRDTSDMDDVEYFIRLTVDNKVFHNGHDIDIDSLVDLFGSHAVVFLKHNSKFDVGSLTEGLSYIDANLPVYSQYIFDFTYLYRDFREVLGYIDKNNLVIDDQELALIAREYASYEKSLAQSEINTFISANSLAYPKNLNRNVYDQTAIDQLKSKYSTIQAFTHMSDTLLVEKLINTIYNHHTKV